METENQDMKPIPLWVMILIAAVAVCVIMFAFIWEAVYSREPVKSYENYPPPARSDIQDELNNLDWVTQEFLPLNEYSRPGTRVTDISSIVIHFIGNPNTTAMQNRNYFANLSITEETHASSNFIVCLDGAIVQCVPVDEIAYASNHRNIDSISIELCHPDETGRFNDETYESAVRLTAWLCNRYNLTSEDIIRHFDVSGKNCPTYFVENEAAWETFKTRIAQAMRQ